MAKKRTPPWIPSIGSWLRSGGWGLLCINTMVVWIRAIAMPLIHSQASFLVLIALGLGLLIPLIALLNAWGSGRLLPGQRNWRAALAIWGISVTPWLLVMAGMLLLTPAAPSVPWLLSSLCFYGSAILYEMRKQSGVPD